MRYPFSYEVIIIDAFDTSHYFKECGMGLAENFTEAMEYIEDYYGEELIAVKHLELFEENELIILSPKVIKNYAKGKYSGIPCDKNGDLIENQED
jgi:hypothetical protein